MIGNPMGNVLGNPLGNPLGLGRSESSKIPKCGVLILTFIEGAGEFVIPAGFKYAEVWGASSGAAGSNSPGASGAWAKSPTLNLGGGEARIKYSVGSVGLPTTSAIDGTTKVEGPGFSYELRGAVSSSPGTVVSASEGVESYAGKLAVAALNLQLAPGGSSRGYSGGGAGLGGLAGGAGLGGAEYNGASSLSYWGPAQIFTPSTSIPNINSGTKGRSAGQNNVGIKSGDGGEGGGGGGAISDSSQQSKGGSGVVRIFAWNPPATGQYAEEA